jgi:hypothetical protein
MQLPNRDNAYIPPPKLTEYLLSETHAVGKSKAKFFRSLGFSETNIGILEQQLLTIAQTEQITQVTPSPYGTKYVIDGMIETPDGDLVQLKTIWIIEEDEDRPRFVTAYPV